MQRDQCLRVLPAPRGAVFARGRRPVPCARRARRKSPCGRVRAASVLKFAGAPSCCIALWLPSRAQSFVAWQKSGGTLHFRPCHLCSCAVARACVLQGGRMGLFIGSKVACVCMPSMPPCWRVRLRSGCGASAGLVVRPGQYFEPRCLVGPQLVFLERPAHGAGRMGGLDGYPGLLTYLCAHLCASCASLCIYVYVHIYVYICKHTHIYIYIYVYMCICVYTYVCIYVYVYVHEYIHTCRQRAGCGAPSSLVFRPGCNDQVSQLATRYCLHNACRLLVSSSSSAWVCLLSVLTCMGGMGCPRCDRRDGLGGAPCTAYCKQTHF